MLQFDDTYDPNYLGFVREVDTRQVSIQVDTDEELRRARVGRLVALTSEDRWLIGLVSRVSKDVQDRDEDDTELTMSRVKVIVVGTLSWDSFSEVHSFSRSVSFPDIDSRCFVLEGENLKYFMSILSRSGDQSLEIGRYSLDETAKAFVDGDKLFQRHAALLGSTGSGKSWTVAKIIESASGLPAVNLVIFDLHGEYKSLDYACHYRVPGPEELGSTDSDLLFLPYWLLNAEELQSMFIDRSEFNAHNQVSAFADAVLAQKRAMLVNAERADVLESFTIDSPIPFSIDEVVDNLAFLNAEMVQGTRGEKQGPLFGQFSRMLARIKSRLSDRRYGFMFQAPEVHNSYGAMGELASKLMAFGNGAGVKVIDFSEVPSEILPIIIGLVARLIYQVQFWTDPAERHPIALVCDEAHLYLPNKDGANPVKRRAIEAFEKIAKEGRKYAVSLFIVSQCPSDVSPVVLSQCNNVLALRLTNTADQAAVKQLMPESMESMLDILPVLDIGEVLVVGDSVLLPSRIKVIPPRLRPLSATVEFWSKWSASAAMPDWGQVVENMRKQGRS